MNEKEDQDDDIQYEKYRIGDLFIDTYNESDQVASYIYDIEYQPDSKITYYWMRYLNESFKDTYWDEIELDEMITNGVKYYPVKE